MDAVVSLFTADAEFLAEVLDKDEKNSEPETTGTVVETTGVIIEVCVLVLPSLTR